MKKLLSIIGLIFLILYSGTSFATTYYIDFDNGNDTQSGTSMNNAWKHCPGDENATGIPASVELNPGDILLFKGGVRYKGSVKVLFSGILNEAVIYRGNTWPGLEGVKAIIDGSENLTGWIPEVNNMYSTQIPEVFTEETTPIMYNLHEYSYSSNEDEFLWVAQDPNPPDPFFNSDRSSFITISNQNITRTSITDPVYFNQEDEHYWDNSFVLVWINPNVVVAREILSYHPDTHTITFEDLGENAIYPDERDQSYAIYNSIHALDNEGEYYVNKAVNKIYLRSRNATNIDSSVSYSARNSGFDINGQSHIRVEGFVIQKISGEELRDAVGIGCLSSSSVPVEDIEIIDNEIYHARHADRGYGGIFLSNGTNCLIQGNVIKYCPDNRGIFVSGSHNVTVRNNYIVRSGITSLTMYSCTNSKILYNTISESKGDHANGITIYIASKNILVAGNKVYDSNSPFTFQDSGDLYFINNLIDANEGESNVNEWGRTSRGPWEYGKIVFLNNTFVRNSRNAAVNIGSGAEDLVVNDTLTIPGNTYVFMNNLIDGGASGEEILRDYNIYTGLSWSQDDRYGWSLESNETVNEDIESLFLDPGNEDFHLVENSDAVNAGTSVVQYYPTDVFPDFNFLTDIEGKLRPFDGAMDIGAYEYGNGPFVDTGDQNYFQKESFNDQIRIFPNPVTQQFYICLNNEELLHAEVRLYSLDGKLTKVVDLESLVNSVDISDIASGIYILTFNTHLLQQAHYKLIKK